jgi:hypothetical protein
MSEARLYETIEHKLEPEELVALGHELADLNQLVIELVADKKAKLADFSARRQELDQQIAILSGKIQSGIDTEQVELVVLMDTPSAGKKSFLRLDNNEVLRIVDMTPQERQQSFGFDIGEDDSPQEEQSQ